jgi:hypothetical protein
VYRVTLSEPAQEQAAALPSAGREALDEVLRAIGLAPWEGEPYSRRNPEGAVRTWQFADGAGLVVYLIVDHQRWVDVLMILWLDYSAP